jgi:hypothetical protein
MAQSGPILLRPLNRQISNLSTIIIRVIYYTVSDGFCCSGNGRISRRLNFAVKLSNIATIMVKPSMDFSNRRVGSLASNQQTK